MNYIILDDETDRILCAISDFLGKVPETPGDFYCSIANGEDILHVFHPWPGNIKNESDACAFWKKAEELFVSIKDQDSLLFCDINLGTVDRLLKAFSPDSSISPALCFSKCFKETHKKNKGVSGSVGSNERSSRSIRMNASFFDFYADPFTENGRFNEAKDIALEMLSVLQQNYRRTEMSNRINSLLGDWTGPETFPDYWSHDNIGPHAKEIFHKMNEYGVAIPHDGTMLPVLKGLFMTGRGGRYELQVNLNETYSVPFSLLPEVLKIIGIGIFDEFPAAMMQYEDICNFNDDGLCDLDQSSHKKCNADECEDKLIDPNFVFPVIPALPFLLSFYDFLRSLLAENGNQAYQALVFSKEENLFKIQVMLNSRKNGNLERMHEHYAEAQNNAPSSELKDDVFRNTGLMVYYVCHCIVLHRTAPFTTTCFGNGFFPEEPEQMIHYSAVHDQTQNLDIITFKWRIQ